MSTQDLKSRIFRVKALMGRDYNCYDHPFVLFPPKDISGFKRFSWDDPPAENPVIKGWTPASEQPGPFTGEALWVKGPHRVEVCWSNEILQADMYLVSDNRKALESFKKDFRIKGRICENERIVHVG